MEEDAIDYSSVAPEVAKEVLRLGEVQLQAYQALAIGGNQRAATLCGILTAAAVGAVGGAAAGLNVGDIRFALSAGLVAVMLLAGAALCIAALWPATFYAPGYSPSDLLNRGVLFGNMEDTTLHLAGLYAQRISDNRRTLIGSARLFRLAAVVGCGAPICGFGLFLSLL